MIFLASLIQFAILDGKSLVDEMVYLFVEVPEVLAGTVDLFGFTYPSYRFAIIAVGLLVAVGSYLLIHKTRVGMLIRAGAQNPLMVSARKGDDMSFTLTTWGEGIRPYDFELPYGYQAAEDIIHTVFDRALVRQGEGGRVDPTDQDFARRWVQ
mgnify:CR=1 FL=1